MGKRKGSGLAKDLIAISSKLPWWVGLLLAAISFAFFNAFADISFKPPPSTSQLGSYAITMPLKVIAFILQFLVPFCFILGAIGSAFGRAKRSELVKKVANDPGGDELRELSWQNFELVVGEAFRLQGYTVNETGGGGADGGIDLKLTKQGKTYFVQCKHWRAWKVSVPVVRELYGVMAAENAAGGFVITTGQFTSESIAFAQGKNIELIDGLQLKRLIDQVNLEKSEPQVSRSESNRSRLDTPVAIPTKPSSPDEVKTPTCPRCGKPMIQRMAKQGQHVGEGFWGCSTFPVCRGIRKINQSG
jgi:restriction system protein